MAYVVGVLSQFLNAPTNDLLNVARRMLRYTKHRVKQGMFYPFGDGLHAKDFNDVDWASSKEDKRSVLGYLFILGTKTISWSSKKKFAISHSFTEPIYRDFALSTCEIMWIKKLFKDVDVHVEVFPLYGDNKLSIFLISNLMFPMQSKHI